MSIISTWNHTTPLTPALSAMISMLDDSNNDIDKALARLLLVYGDMLQPEMLSLFHQPNQEEALGLFYSSFRKYDMTSNGHIDMAFWYLVNHNTSGSVLEQAFLAGYEIEQKAMSDV